MPSITRAKGLTGTERLGFGPAPSSQLYATPEGKRLSLIHNFVRPSPRGLFTKADAQGPIALSLTRRNPTNGKRIRVKRNRFIRK